MTLEDIIRDAATRAARTLKTLGFVPITFIGYRVDDNIGFMFDQQSLIDLQNTQNKPLPVDNKDFLVHLGRSLVQLVGCTQVVHYAEAWRVKLDASDEAGAEAELDAMCDEDGDVLVSTHPGREECIHYVAEDCDGNRLIGGQTLLRPAGFKPYVEAVQIDDGSSLEGRFTGFFSKDAKRNLRPVIIAYRERLRKNR